MYHRSNNGMSAQYADMDGFVGQYGDKFEQFNFDLHYDPTDATAVAYYRDVWFPAWIEDCESQTALLHEQPWEGSDKAAFDCIGGFDWLIRHGYEAR